MFERDLKIEKAAVNGSYNLYHPIPYDIVNVYHSQGANDDKFLSALDLGDAESRNTCCEWFQCRLAQIWPIDDGINPQWRWTLDHMYVRLNQIIKQFNDVALVGLSFSCFVIVRLWYDSWNKCIEKKVVLKTPYSF